eukprot:6979593-Heterocapsa_arctica.AAC.1
MAENGPYSFWFLRVVVATNFKEKGVTLTFWAHGRAAIDQSKVRGEGFAELGVVRIGLDLEIVVLQVLDFLKGVPIFFRDLPVHPLYLVDNVLMSVGSRRAEEELLDGIGGAQL